MGRRSWQQRWQGFVDAVSSPDFWLTLAGVLAVLLVWFYLFYLGLKYDVRMPLHATFCSSHEERDKHILMIVMTIPFFIMGMAGTISEWMTIMANRRAGRRNRFKSLIFFLVILQVSAVIILSAFQC